MSDRNVRFKVEVDSELPTLDAQLQSLVAREKELVSSLEQLRTASATQSSQQITAINAVTTALKEQQTTSKKTSDDTAAGVKNINDQFTNLSSGVRSFTSLVATAFTLNEIKGFVSDIIEAKTSIDSVKISLDTMIGSKRESAELYQQIFDLAKQTPFTLQEVSEQVTKLKAYNIETADLIPTITSLGNIAAAVGKEKLPQLTLAYGQVANAGKLMGTELKQFTEAGVPLLDLIAKSYDKTKESVIAMAADHTISFGMVRKAIMDASAEGGKYEGLMTKLAQTVGGQISNLADTFFVAKGRIGDFFEDQIAGGTKTLQSLITTLAGSNAAIDRTVTYVESIATAFVTWKVAMNAQAVASAAWAVATKTGELVMGTYNLALIAVKGTTEGFTEAQVASSVAAKGLWSTISANPIGAFIAVVGLATSAFLAWKAAHVEVTQAMGDAEYAVVKERDNLNKLADAALSATSSKKQHKLAIQELISSFPEYFSGLDAEKTSNDQLKSILDKVNLSYEQRIVLARQAYDVEKLNEKQRNIWDEQASAIEKLVARVPALKQFGNDAVGVMEYLSKNADANFKARNANGIDSWLDQAVNGNPVKTLETLNANLKEVDNQLKAATEKTKSVTAKEQDDALAAVKAHYAALREQADGNSKQIAKINEDEKVAISKANGTYRTSEIKETVDHTEKLKEINVLSAKEIAVLVKQTQQETLNDRLKFLDAEEKAEIEAVNKVTVSRKITNAQRVALEEEVTQKILAIHADFDLKRAKLIEQDRENFSRSLDVDISSALATFDKIEKKNGEYVSKRVDSFKEIAKESEESEKRAQAATLETARINKETDDINLKSKKEILNLTLDLLGQQSGFIGQASQAIKAVYLNLDSLSGRAQEVATQTVDAAKLNLQLISATYEAGIKGTVEDVANAEKQLASAENKAAQVKSDSAAAAIGLFSTVFQIASAIASAFNDMQAEVYKAISDGLTKSKEIYNSFFEFVKTGSAEAYKTEMEAFNGTLEERIKKINDFYDKQKVLAEGADRINALLDYNKKVVDIEINKNNSLNGLIDAQIAKESAANDLFLEQKEKAIIAQAEREKAQAADVLAAKLDAIDKELTAYKAAKQAEIDALNATLASEKAANEQASSDDQLRLTADDIFRKQLLTDGEAREVAALEAAKQRELARAKTAEERAQITIAFDKLIAEKHAEYEDAMGDKTKEISLANQEAKAQEADNAQSLEAKTANLIGKILEQISAEEAAAANDRLEAQQVYANQVLAANKAIFESTKKLKIIELQAEIAILNAKRGLFGDAAVDQAIGSLNQAIASVQGLQYGSDAVVLGKAQSKFSQTVVDQIKDFNTPKTPINKDTKQAVSAAYDQNGNAIALSYDSTGHEFGAFDANKNPFTVAYARGFVKATNTFYFKGTDYAELGENPDGRDTIPAMINKGERVVPTRLNELLGGKNLSNEELVENQSAYSRLIASLPSGTDIMSLMDIGSTAMQLPAGLLNGRDGGSQNSPDLLREIKGLRTDIQTKKLLQINMDEHGFAKHVIGAQSKITYMTNLLTR